MDYKKAQQLKNKSLLSLIAEKKFERGEGLGSSIGGAISEKFKAKVTRTKEKFDPLNILSSLVGRKNVFGRGVTTVAGRAFGRSEEDIGYFGGYQKKGRNKKDPRRTTIGPGPIRSLKVGDSTADILGKMYNFMEKTYENELKRYELEKSFREEQLGEDERRHKKLIDELLKSQIKSKEEKKEEKEPSWIDKMLDGMKSALAFVLSPINKILELFSSVLTGLVEIVGKIALKLEGFLGKTALETFLSISPFLEKYVNKSLGFLMKYIFKSLIGTFSSFKGIPGALGKALQIGLAAFGAVEAVDEYFDYQSLINYGSEAEKTNAEYLSKKEQYDKLNENIRALESAGEGIDSPEILKMQKERNELIPLMRELSHKIDVQRGQYAQNVLIPYMESQGYMYDRYNKDESKDGLPRFRNPKGELISPFGPEMLEAAKFLPLKEYSKKTLKEVQSEAEEVKNKIEDKVTPFITPIQKNLDDMKLKLQNLDEFFTGESSTIINNSTNNVGGGAPKIQDTTPVQSRDKELSFINMKNYVAV
jgi:hypothetical protein